MGFADGALDFFGAGFLGATLGLFDRAAVFFAFAAGFFFGAALGFSGAALVFVGLAMESSSVLVVYGF